MSVISDVWRYSDGLTKNPIACHAEGSHPGDRGRRAVIMFEKLKESHPEGAVQKRHYHPIDWLPKDTHPAPTWNTD